MSLSIHLVTGASIMRSTNTWSPISRVFSMELDGISKACSAKVMMNRPVTITMAMEAINSGVVSLCLVGFSGSAALAGFRDSAVFSAFCAVFAKFLVVAKGVLPRLSAYPPGKLLHGPQNPPPTQTLDQGGHIVRQTRKSIRRQFTGDVWSSTVHREVNQQRPADNVLGGNKTPVARVVTVVAVVAENKKRVFGDNQLVILQQLLRL